MTTPSTNKPKEKDAGARGTVGIRAVQVSIAIVFAWGVGMAVGADAHEKHAQPVRVRPPHGTVDSGAAPIPRESVPADGAVPDSVAVEPPFKMPPIGEAVGHHLHNKLVHFPLVLAPAVLLVLLLARRRTDLGGLARVLSWVAAASAGAALWAGLNQASDFGREPKEWLVLVHRGWGIGTTAALVLTALLGHWRRTRPYAWVMALLAVVLVGVAGYLGGLVSHG